MPRVRRFVCSILLLLAWTLPLLGPTPTVSAGGPGQYPLGLLPSQGDFPRLDLKSLETLASLPTSVDLSAYLPPVGQQGTANCCSAWVLGYYLKSYQEGREWGWDVRTAAHQFSPSWLYNQRPAGDCTSDDGMSFSSALHLLQSQGAATLAAFPYDQNDICTQPSAEVMAGAYPYRIASYANVFCGAGTADLTVLKTLLSQGVPVAMAMPVYDSFYDGAERTPAFIDCPSAGETYWGGHGMLVVGYDDAIGGFKAVNSWGLAWGDRGYCYLSYAFVQQKVWEAWTAEDYVADLFTQDIALSAGWNLVALSLEPYTHDVSVLLGSAAADIEQVCVWQAAAQQWQHYAPAQPPFTNNLQTLAAEQGVWILVEQDCTLRVRGSAWQGPVELVAGWNLVAYPGSTSQPVATALVSLGDKWTGVQSYQPGSGEGGWLSYYRGVPAAANTLQTLDPGRGYWLYVTEACTWSGDSSL